MMAQNEITVILPHQLRERAGGARSVAVSAQDVRGAIKALDERVPGLVFNICLETGELRPFVNVFVRQEDIRYLDGLDTRIDPGETIHIIHSVAGGCRAVRIGRRTI
jgi:molybdopterin synthase sulfur carrier subunit